MTLTYKRLDPSLWNDFETLFLRDKGTHASCFCVYNRITMGEYIQSTTQWRRAKSKEWVLSGQATGILVYEDDVPVAWCQYGKAAEFGAFDKRKDYLALNLSAELRPTWRITCLFVTKNHRDQGLSGKALDAALDEIAKAGGGIVEVFVLKNPKREKIEFTGSVEMYQRRGFSYVAPIGSTTHLLRRNVEATR
jgi:GNAT superfamily N-acetyltransferase